MDSSLRVAGRAKLYLSNKRMTRPRYVHQSFLFFLFTDDSLGAIISQNIVGTEKSLHCRSKNLLTVNAQTLFWELDKF